MLGHRSPEEPVLAAQPAVLRSAAHHLGQLSEAEWLQDVVEGLELEGLDGRFDFGVAGDDDYLAVLSLRSHGLQHFDAVLLGDAEIEEDEVELLLGQGGERGLAVRYGDDEVPEPDERRDQRVAEVRVILHDEQPDEVRRATIRLQTVRLHPRASLRRGAVASEGTRQVRGKSTFGRGPPGGPRRCR